VNGVLGRDQGFIICKKCLDENRTDDS